MLAASLLAVVVGYAVYRWLTRGETRTPRGIDAFAGEV